MKVNNKMISCVHFVKCQDLIPWKVFGVERCPTGDLSGVPECPTGDTCCRPIKAESRNWERRVVTDLREEARLP